METAYTEQRVDFVLYLATSQRIGFERQQAKFEAQNGDTHAAVARLRRLADETQHACTSIANTQVQAGADSERLASVTYMLNEQLVLITTHLSRVEQDVELSLEGGPMTPPVEFSVPAEASPQLSSLDHMDEPLQVFEDPIPAPTDSRLSPFPPPIQEDYNPFPPSRFNPTTPAPTTHTSKHENNTWPTADPSYAHPALEPVSLKETSAGPRLAGDVSGALYIRQQLDEQEERAEAEQRAKWELEIGVKVPEAPKNLRKRKGDHLPGAPSKRQHTEGGGLRGGRERDGSSGGFKKLWRNISQAFKGGRKTLADEDGDGNATAPATSAEEEHTHIDHEGCLIKMSSLQPEFEPGDWKEKATRESLAAIIGMCEATPSRLKPTPGTISPGHAKHKRGLERLLTFLKSVQLDDFDTSETRASLEDLAAFMETTTHQVAEGPEQESDREVALANAAASIADFQDRLDRQRAYAAKVFVGGEATGEVFASWIRTAREWFAEEMDFGERACQEPVAVTRGRGRGRRSFYSV